MDATIDILPLLWDSRSMTETVQSERCPAVVEWEEGTSSDSGSVSIGHNVDCELPAGHDGEHQGRADVGPLGHAETVTIVWSPGEPPRLG